MSTSLAADSKRNGAVTRDTILDAAERVFGSTGYAGSSMREISAEAGVAQALLHYHFKAKDTLYAEVFTRRAAQIVQYRLGLLRELNDDAASPGLEEVLAILVTPLQTIFAGRGQDSQYYLQMVAEVTVAADERSIAIVSKFYDPVGKEMVAALMRALPGLSEGRAAWVYLFAIGARMQAHARNGRVGRLAGAQAAQEQPHALLVPFLAAGIRAAAAMPEARASKVASGTRRAGKPRASA